MTYRTEFPDFPPESMPAIPAGWIDTSWHNDTCPSFETAEGSGLRVFVDYADDACREVQGCRFSVIDDMANGGDGQLLLETDDWSAVLQLLGA